MDPITIAMLAMQAYNTLKGSPGPGFQPPQPMKSPEATSPKWRVLTKNTVPGMSPGAPGANAAQFGLGNMHGEQTTALQRGLEAAVPKTNFQAELKRADENKPAAKEGSTTLEKMSMGASIGQAAQSLLNPPSQRPINFGSRASGARPSNVSSRHLIGPGGKTPSLQELIAAMLRGR